MAERLTCAVVDDDAGFLRMLRGYVQRAAGELGVTPVIKEFSDPLDLIEDYAAAYDVIFLDIEMPQMDGMKLAHKIREVDEGVCIIFVTNMAQFAIGGYEVGATDFIVKPVTYETFALKLRRALRSVELHREVGIALKDGETRVVVPCSEIYYVEKNKNYAVFHTARGEFRRRSSLGDVARELGSAPFAQANSGTLVNLGRVTTYDGREVTMADGSVLSLSRSRRDGFVGALMDYLGA